VPGPTTSTYVPSSTYAPIGTTQKSHLDESVSPSSDQISQEFTGPLFDLNSPCAPMGINQVPNVFTSFPSISTFYSPPPRIHAPNGRYFPHPNLVNPAYRATNPGYAQVGPQITQQVHRDPSMNRTYHTMPEGMSSISHLSVSLTSILLTHRLPSAGPSNAEKGQNYHYNGFYNPNNGQSMIQAQFGSANDSTDLYWVGLHSPRNYACIRIRGCGYSHIPFMIILTVVGFSISVLIFLCYKGHLGTLNNASITTIFQDIGSFISGVYRFIVNLSPFRSRICID
jgi:hypothetical protein